MKKLFLILSFSMLFCSAALAEVSINTVAYDPDSNGGVVSTASQSCIVNIIATNNGPVSADMPGVTVKEISIANLSGASVLAWKNGFGVDLSKATLPKQSIPPFGSIMALTPPLKIANGALGAGSYLVKAILLINGQEPPVIRITTLTVVQGQSSSTSLVGSPSTSTYSTTTGSSNIYTGTGSGTGTGSTTIYTSIGYGTGIYTGSGSSGSGTSTGTATGSGTGTGNGCKEPTPEECPKSPACCASYRCVGLEHNICCGATQTICGGECCPVDKPICYSQKYETDGALILSESCEGGIPKCIVDKDGHPVVLEPQPSGACSRNCKTSSSVFNFQKDGKGKCKPVWLTGVG